MIQTLKAPPKERRRAADFLQSILPECGRRHDSNRLTQFEFVRPVIPGIAFGGEPTVEFHGQPRLSKAALGVDEHDTMDRFGGLAGLQALQRLGNLAIGGLQSFELLTTILAAKFKIEHSP